MRPSWAGCSRRSAEVGPTGAGETGGAAVPPALTTTAGAISALGLTYDQLRNQPRKHGLLPARP
jgi:hypothetical protein